jgi:hypothetical protein
MAKKIAGKNVGSRCDAEDNGEQRERELGEVEEESFMALEADDVGALAAAASKCVSLGITLDDVRPAPEAGMFAGGARTHGLAWQLNARRSLDWLLDHSSDKGVGGEMGEIDLMSALVVCVFVSPDGSERDEALGSLEWLVGRLDGAGVLDARMSRVAHLFTDEASQLVRQVRGRIAAEREREEVGKACEAVGAAAAERRANSI